MAQRYQLIAIPWAVSYTELNYAQMDTEALCTRSFISYLYICAFIICTEKKEPLQWFFLVKLPHLITKHWDALLSTNDHMKCKNNMKADNLSGTNTDPRKSKSSSLKILVQDFLSDSYLQAD